MKIKSFGEILREKRKAKGWSQSKLAKKANTCTSAISGYEIGRSVPSLYLACDLARALGCEVEELIGRPSKTRQFKEALMRFFSNDNTLAMFEVDAEYINEQIGNIANGMEGEK
jgi:transcriptional regulator with XRE-family HTH domain